MSMILDALARAQRERDRGVDVRHADLSLQDTESATEKKQTTIIRIVVVALLVNALVLSILLVVKPWHQRQPVDNAQLEVSGQTTAAGAGSQADVNPQVANDVAPSATGKDISVAITTHARTAVENLSDQMAISKPKTTLVEPPKIVKKPMLSTAPAQSAVAEQGAEYRGQQGDYVQLHELSANEKSAFSRYDINVHVYDQDPAKSFVLINMTRLRNGDRIPGGPLVDRITPEGVVLSQNGRNVLIERN